MSCFRRLSESLTAQREQASIPLENSVVVTKELLSNHSERVCHEITKFVVMITQVSPEADGVEKLGTNLLRYVDAYLCLHRVLLHNAGTTKRTLCVKASQDFLNSLQLVFTQSRDRLLGRQGEPPAIGLAVEKKNQSVELSSAGVSLAAHTGACLEACKALVAVPLSNHAAVTKALLSLLSLVKDARGEIVELAEGGAEDEGDEEASEEDLRRVKLAAEMANLVYSTVRKLYDFCLRCPALENNPGHVEWLEGQLLLATRLSTSLDNLGSTLYSPQEVQDVRECMGVVGSQLDALLAQFPAHSEFHNIFKLTFSAKEQQAEPAKLQQACDAFIAKCRQAADKIVKQC